MMIALFFQYYPNYVMISIETLISLLILYFIVRIANSNILKEDYISLNNKNRSINFSLLIVLGVILAIRYILAYLGYFSQEVILLNNEFFFFAVMSSIFYLFLNFFIKKFRTYREDINHPNQNNKFLKRGILIIGASWINALIFLSIDILGIPLGDLIPSDLYNPSYDVFLLGFEWAFFIVIMDVSLTIIINRTYPIEKRFSKEVLNNSILFSTLISFGIWSIQLIVVELYLKRLFQITLYEQDIRILALVVSTIYISVFFIVSKTKFLPDAIEKSKIKALKAMDLSKEVGLKIRDEDNIILDVKDLTTYFYTEEGVVKAVEEVSFEIKEGEVLGLVGETGCGKTVTALSILKLIQPPGKIEKGSVRFGNKDLSARSEREILPYRGNEITMIFQDPLNSLNPVFKIGNQISEVFLLHKKHELIIESSKLNKSIFSIAKDWSLQLLRELGIPAPENVFNLYPHELSGGMRQRVQIAMALACSPKLLIADEPTTALDVTIQNQILQLMKDLKSKYNTSILFITHDLGIISKMCNRVAVMYCGYIVEYGYKKVLFSKPYHPYTKKLISSIPIVGKKKDLLEIIPGMVPNLIYPPSGCRFHPRCGFCFEPCDSIIPELLEVNPNYFVSCHLYDPKYNKEVIIK